jgi:hypothetical protein
VLESDLLTPLQYCIFLVRVLTQQASLAFCWQSDFTYSETLLVNLEMFLEGPFKMEKATVFDLRNSGSPWRELEISIKLGRSMNSKAFKLKIVSVMTQSTINIQICRFYTGVLRNKNGNHLCHDCAKPNQLSELALVTEG